MTDYRIPDFKKSNGGRSDFTTKISSTATDDDSATNEDKATLLGTLVLLTVPLSWGTYVPVVRYLYKIDPPVPGFVFSACYYTLAAVTMSILSQQSRSSSFTSAELEEEAVIRNDELSTQSIIPFEGGIELGIYLFIANCLQVIGLQTVESDRAGFLVQLTTVMVPVCEGIFAGSLFLIPARTWVACVMAFLGLCIMGLDGKISDINDPGEALVGVALNLSKGDLLILGAAVLYTLHVVRLGTYARQTNPLNLAASKATTECILSFALIIFLVSTSLLQDTYHVLDVTGKDNLMSFSIDSGREISSFFSSFISGVRDGSISTPTLLPAFGSILWTGWITCAYTIWAQSFGQSKVSPTSANLIYTFQPIFTALFAYVLLGEKMGSVGILGGSMIASAVYIIASSGSDDSETTYKTG
eukprot:CAMPEP_0197185762 /NCGR_PEP_ID=MMETSP1423-20130617/12639_1 /TAXON_ID=476441 /ORGANISM="Pseudo-nitzschia heimii, Strain UNC1101" /LENGTH=414 /DNA_ID=CAMNT_0042636911 /DNA_START=227 /DNA_END=1471 /DNA_ORIENTATION=-